MESNTPPIGGEDAAREQGVPRTYIYQIRLERAGDPLDVVGDIANAVWKALPAESGVRLPAHWSAFYSDFFKVFKRRLVRREECGTLPKCKTNLRPAMWDQPGSDRYFWRRGRLEFEAQDNYTLELRQELNEFLRCLADVALRRLRQTAVPTLRPHEREMARVRLLLAVREGLAPYVYHSDLCLNCLLRERPGKGIGWL